MLRGSSPKPPDTEGVSAITGVPENVVLDCVGVKLAEEAAVASYFLLLLLANAMKMMRPKPSKAMIPTVMLDIVATPIVDALVVFASSSTLASTMLTEGSPKPRSLGSTGLT